VTGDATTWTGSDGEAEHGAVLASNRTCPTPDGRVMRMVTSEGQYGCSYPVPSDH
jgi:hypothetical protein